MIVADAEGFGFYGLGAADPREQYLDANQRAMLAKMAPDQREWLLSTAASGGIRGATAEAHSLDVARRQLATQVAKVEKKGKKASKKDVAKLEKAQAAGEAAVQSYQQRMSQYAEPAAPGGGGGGTAQVETEVVDTGRGKWALYAALAAAAAAAVYWFGIRGRGRRTATA